jgi:hypothetical protein
MKKIFKYFLPCFLFLLSSFAFSQNSNEKICKSSNEFLSAYEEKLFGELMKALTSGDGASILRLQNEGNVLEQISNACGSNRYESCLMTDDCRKLMTDKYLLETNLLNQDNTLNKILAQKKLTLIYKSGDFAIAKSEDGRKNFYFLQGVLKKESEVQDQIRQYQAFLAQKNEQAKIKDKNLAYPWRVVAEAVCPQGYRCWIKAIRDSGRLDDGSVRFNIEYESWRGHGGSSGVATIECGFNRSNYLKSTSVNAKCM